MKRLSGFFILVMLAWPFFDGISIPIMSKAIGSERVQEWLTFVDNSRKLRHIEACEKQIKDYKIRNNHLVNRRQVDYFSVVSNIAYSYFWKTLYCLSSFYDEKYTECSVCFDSSFNFPALSCGHITCNTCCETWYRQKVNEGDTQFTCTSSGCGCELDDATVENFLDTDGKLKLRQSRYKKDLASCPEKFKKIVSVKIAWELI